MMGTDSHELQGLDDVQCVALVETNQGIVNLTMNEYACYGKVHTIHSWVFLVHLTFQIGILSLMTRIRILLNGGTALSKSGPTQS